MSDDYRKSHYEPPELSARAVAEFIEFLRALKPEREALDEELAQAEFDTCANTIHSGGVEGHDFQPDEFFPGRSSCFYCGAPKPPPPSKTVRYEDDDTDTRSERFCLTRFTGRASSRDGILTDIVNSESSPW